MTPTTAMHGKTVLITGTNSGIGFATARQLAEHGAHVVMLCRDEIRGANAQRAVAAVATGPAPDLFVADLSSQQAVRTVATAVRARFTRLDVLIHNAGAVFARRELTVDGIEKTLATNHLAPFLLTQLLLDLVIAAPAGRIVTVASESHSGSIDFANLQGTRRYGWFGAYNSSKLANILFTYELARRLDGTGVTANCVSPGPSVTPFGENMQGLQGLLVRLMKRIPILFSSAEQGAATPVYVASDPALDGVTGKFFLRRHQQRTKQITYSLEAAARLWSVSERLCTPRALRRNGSALAVTNRTARGSSWPSTHVVASSPALEPTP